MSVFNSLYANQYDQMYAEKGYGSECDLVESAVKRYASAAPKSLIDVGCGTGGHALEMAKRGYDVTGVDLSNHMLECAKGKSALIQGIHQPTWVCGDARSFDAAGPFDLGIMMFAVVGYLTSNEDVLMGLRNIRRHLKPGALFICDFWYGPSVLTVRPGDRVRVLSTPDGQIIRAASTTLDTAKHTADVTFKLWTMSQDRLVGESRETHRMRYFFPQEFELFLSMAGFKLRGMTAFPTLDEPMTDETWNALVVAQAI